MPAEKYPEEPVLTNISMSAKDYYYPRPAGGTFNTVQELYDIALLFKNYGTYASGKLGELYILYAHAADDLVGANREIEERDITIGDLITQIGGLATQIGSLTILINSLSTDNTETKRQRDEAIAQRGELQAQHGELQAQHEELQAQLGESTEARNELQGQYDTTLSELRDATERLEEVESAFDKAGNVFAADNPEWADKGLDLSTFVDLKDDFASEDPERIGSAIGTLEGMGINPADIKGERFKFGEGEDEKEYIPTDPPEIPGLFDPEYPEFEEDAKRFLEDEEAKLEFFTELDRVRALEKDPYATPEDKSGALGNLLPKAGPFGSLIGGLASVASPLIKFFQPGEDETPGGETPSGEPVADSIFPKIKIPGPDLGLKLPSFESLIDFSSGKRGLTPEYVEPPVPGVFQTGVRPGEKIPLGELNYEDKPYVGLFAKEDKEGNYLQYPFPFGKDKLKYPEAALLETDLSKAALL